MARKISQRDLDALEADRAAAAERNARFNAEQLGATCSVCGCTLDCVAVRQETEGGPVFWCWQHFDWGRVPTIRHGRPSQGQLPL